MNFGDDFELIRLQHDGDVLEVSRVLDLRRRQQVRLVLQFIGHSDEIEWSDALLHKSQRLKQIK